MLWPKMSNLVLNLAPNLFEFDNSALDLHLYRLSSSAHHLPCHSLSRRSVLTNQHVHCSLNVLGAFRNETRNQAWIVKESAEYGTQSL